MTNFKSTAPIFPVRSVRKALEHYKLLGFDVHAYEENKGDEPIYGYASAGAIDLHFALMREINPHDNSSACYIYVDDADSLHKQWEVARIPGRLTAPSDTAYGLREFGHVDPDGNLLRIGSSLK